MSFELTDEEALEVLPIADKKLTAIRYVLGTAEKGAKVYGKEKLAKRITILEPLIERLTNKYK